MTSPVIISTCIPPGVPDWRVDFHLRVGACNEADKGARVLVELGADRAKEFKRDREVERNILKSDGSASCLFDGKCRSG